MLSALLFTALAPVVNLKPVIFTEVKIHDKFWSPRIETNRTVSIPHSLKMLEESGTIRNFEIAARRERTGFTGLVFQDSDLYKSLEAAAYSLANHPDLALEKKLDEIIGKIAAAQMPDGYLNTWYQIKEPENRLTDLANNHELYCVGHMYEAAVAFYEATGKTSLLEVAKKNADFLAQTFGKEGREGYCGHPEIELALMKLWRVTKQQRYFDLARFFVETRGSHFFAKEHKWDPAKYDGTYWLDDVPIYDHKNIKGHAVRACYLFSGVTDVAAETKDARLLSMLDRVWKNTTYRNMYITGGIGPSAHNEGFTVDYDLPNDTAYQETCASIALLQWNHRLGMMYGDSKYWDQVERSLYNGFLSGVSLTGDRFFYVNPLGSKGTHHRSGWFSCACCPPNVTRTLASLGQYLYAKSDKELLVNVFIDSTVQTEVGPDKVTLNVKTDYPWNGKVVLEPKGFKSSTLAIRVPEWCSKASISAPGVNSATVNGYLKIWNFKEGQPITIDFPMPVERIAANPEVKANMGKTAIQRGPVVYCLEQADTQVDPAQIFLPLSAKLTPKASTELGGVTVLTGQAFATERESWTKTLYKPAGNPKPIDVVAIPYYAWDNRTPGGMAVWLPMNPLPSVAGGLEQTAELSLSFKSGNAQPEGIRDGKDVTKSSTHPGSLCHFWPHKGGTEWVQYTWKTPQVISGTKLYWFDDTGVGECRLPDSYEIQVLDGQVWKPVTAAFPNKLDEWLTVSFEPVKTTAIRLVVNQKQGFASGIHEWKILGDD